MKKKFGILIIILLSVVLIGGGCFLVFNNSTKQKKEEKKIIEDSEWNEFGIINNTSETIAAKHCLDTLCITDLTIDAQQDFGSIFEGKLVNEGTELLEHTYIKLVFTVNKEEKSFIYYFDTLAASETFDLMIQNEDETLVKATDYKIVAPTDKEIENYQKSITVTDDGEKVE